MLTVYQKSSARYDGGATIANRKRQLAQVASVLANLHDDCRTSESLAGALTAKEIDAIRAAANVVRAITETLAMDLVEAKSIKRKFDERHKKAIETLRAEMEPRSLVDKIAFAIVVNGRGAIVAFERDCARHGVASELPQLMRGAYASMAHIVASGTRPIGDWCREAIDEIQLTKEREPELIAQIATLAVAQRIECATRKAAA